jgi:hypothetical protein
MKTGKTETGKVIPLHPLKAKRASEQKWGREVMAFGFCIVPSLLLRGQARLKVNATQLAILMHLADFWWDADRKPHPSKGTLAERLHLSARQVQRHIAEMEQMGLVKRIERRVSGRGKRSNYYDLSGLVARLKEIEPDFRKAEEAAREERRKASRPLWKNRGAAAVAQA